MIPKIIHQTWRSEKSINEAFQACVKSIKIKNPDYDYRFYSDQDCCEIVKKEFPEFFGAYCSMSPVEKADLFRYLIVYRDGGIYLDVDCYCVASFDKLIEDAKFVAAYEQGWRHDDIFRYTQWTFAARKGHPLLMNVANKCKKNHIKNPTMWTLKKTGPTMWTHEINNYENYNELKLGGELWFGSRIHGVNERRFVPPHQRKNIIRNINNMIIKKKEIYTVHLFWGSWHNAKKNSKQVLASVRALENYLK